ncbi:DUF58 domain-containing protein [Deinococcus misasensis]|uniref:DUF58 domain-containing protein n=1 Tax=Deinococcus misasensis TaxID=392413 RepID=UPI00054F2625|nr:DUF58 domain-containing protein [Deinococcus misasensis]
MKVGRPRPTRFGWVYLAFGMLSLIGCINYQLSLGYFLCFLLLSIWLGAWVEAFRKLQGVEVQCQPGTQVFAGQALLVRVEVQRTPQQTGMQVVIQMQQQQQAISLVRQTHGVVEMLLDTTRRGWMDVPAFQLQTSDLLGLFRIHGFCEGIPHAALVYPALEDAPMPFPTQGSGTGTSRRAVGQDEYRGLRTYQRGDSLGRVAWKRGELPDGSLLTKEFEGQQGPLLTLDFQQLPSLGTEQKLSRLATWVVQAQKAGLAFQMSIPGFEATGSGERHVQMCLTRLAEHQEAHP